MTMNEVFDETPKGTATRSSVVQPSAPRHDRMYTIGFRDEPQVVAR